MFDDALLDDDAAIGAHDALLRSIASQGARIRTECEAIPDLPGSIDLAPRGIVVVGTEARLIRAVLEPVSSTPLVAWPYPGLPAWVGPLDLVVVLGGHGDGQAEASSAAEAARRGSTLLVTAPSGSLIASQASTRRSCVLVETRTGDPLAAAVAALAILHRAGLGPLVRPDDVAEAADMVAEACSPFRDLAVNPAKDLALGVADGHPLVWGPSVLAARAARRIAEALRRASGRAALSADADALLPVLDKARVRDTFADPFDDAAGPSPVLVMLDDPDATAEQRAAGRQLRDAAAQRRIRVCDIEDSYGSEPLARYVAQLQLGLFGAAYLQLGLSGEF